MQHTRTAQKIGNEDKALKHALAFVKMLTGSANTPLSIRTFDDKRERKDGSLAKKFTAPVANVLAELRQLNEQSAGAFVVINEGGQTGKEITRIRAVFADTDGADLEPLLCLEPHMVVATSPEKWHVYWLVDESFPLEQFKEVQLAIAAKYGTDPAVCDLPRVMRLPGFNHCKGEPFQVRITKLNKALPRYSLEQIIDGLGLELHSDTPPATNYGIPLDDALIVPPEFPDADANRVAEQCAQVKHFKESGYAEGPEPAWRACIGVVKHCTDGEQYVHEWSAKYDGYDSAETQAKIDGWNTAPTTCNTFRELAPERCKGCTHALKSPIWLGVAQESHQVPVWLNEMNARYAWIEQDAGIYRIRYRDFIPMEKFNAAHANQTIEIVDGKTRKDISVSRLWLTHRARAQFRAIVTRPGELEKTADNCLNDWAGFNVNPVAGDLGPFQKLYAYLFGDDRYALLWLAHLIQHPGIKMFVSLVVWSKQEGVGKNLLFETVGTLFNPRHFALIGQSEVDDDFCGWMPGTVFMLGDEIRASKSEKSRDRLKLWGTATTLRTHDKGQPKRQIENLMNQVFLSNHADGMFLSDFDRRFWVHEIKAGPLPETLRDAFLAWRENGGLAHLLHYLLHIDLDGFDPKGRAPATDAKREMIEAGRSDLDRWAMDVISGSLPVGQEVATAERLTQCFMQDYPHVRNPPSVSTVGKVLVRAGAYRRENQVRLSSGRKVRALALVRVDYWRDQPELAWRNELDKRK